MDRQTLSCGLLTVSTSDVNSWAAANASNTTLVNPRFYCVEMCAGLQNVCPYIGRGSFGDVRKGIDPLTNLAVAIKTVKLDGDKAATRVRREYNMQQQCSPHPNVCEARAIIDGPLANSRSIVMDYAEATLLDAQSMKLPEPVLKCIAHQLITGTAWIHSKNVVHRDIKPNNILLDHTGVVRIADFGLAGEVGPDLWQQDKPDLVVTVNYRPPELLLGAASHGFEVDMWSIGCTLAELATGTVLFEGKDEAAVLTNIMRVLGNQCQSRGKYFPWFSTVYMDRLKAAEAKLEGPHGSQAKLNAGSSNTLSSEFFNLLNRLLECDPAKRITAKDALAHPWFKGGHASLREVVEACKSALPTACNPDAAFMEQARLLLSVRRVIDETVNEQLNTFKLTFARVQHNAAHAASPSKDHAMPTHTSMEAVKYDIAFGRFINALAACVERYDTPKILATAAMLRSVAMARAQPSHTPTIEQQQQQREGSRRDGARRWDTREDTRRDARDVKGEPRDGFRDLKGGEPKREEVRRDGSRDGKGAEPKREEVRRDGSRDGKEAEPKREEVRRDGSRDGKGAEPKREEVRRDGSRDGKEAEPKREEVRRDGSRDGKGAEPKRALESTRPSNEEPPMKKPKRSHEEGEIASSF